MKNSQKKILFVTQTLKMGGMARVNAVFANILSEKYPVYISTPYTREKSYFDLKVPHLHSRYVRFVTWGTNGAAAVFKTRFSQKSAYKIQAKLIVQQIKKYQITTAVLSEHFILLTPYIKKIYPGIQLIAWCHSTKGAYFDHNFVNKKQYLKDGLENADAIVCLNQEDKKGFEQYNQNTKVIHNPLTIENKEISTLNQKNIAWVGRIDPLVKGTDYLLEVAKQLPVGWKILVAGGGNADRIAEFEESVIRQGISQRIDYRGALKDVELKKLYKSSSIYLMTSRWEAYPGVLGEAMSFGSPIIAFEQNGSKEMLDNGKYGKLCSPGDVEEMAETIRKFADSLDLRQKYQQLSLQRVEELREEDIVGQWEEILK